MSISMDLERIKSEIYRLKTASGCLLLNKNDTNTLFIFMDDLQARIEELEDAFIRLNDHENKHHQEIVIAEGDNVVRLFPRGNNNNPNAA